MSEQRAVAPQRGANFSFVSAKTSRLGLPKPTAIPAPFSSPTSVCDPHGRKGSAMNAECARP
jgi:hypothetical protein